MDDEETKSILRLILEKLEDLSLSLKRIEERQIVVRQEIKEQAAPEVRLFGSTVTGSGGPALSFYGDQK